MVLLLSKRHNNETKRLNSSAIDASVLKSVLNTNNNNNNQSNCQPVSDEENIGLQCKNNHNGQTISINFKQTKMQVRQYDDIRLGEQQQQQQQQRCANHTVTPKFYHNESRRFHANKMQLIVVLVVYLVSFYAQLAIARPSSDDHHSSDVDTNWEHAALATENDVSKRKFG